MPDFYVHDQVVYDPNFELGQPAASDPIVAAGIRWWGNGGHSVGDAPTATPLDRNFRVSTSALNNVLGVPYGEPREQAGMVGLVHRVNEAQAGSLWVLVFWGRGELPVGGIADLEINDELASGLDWVVSVEHFLGSASQAACTSLTTALASLGFVEAYPGYAYSVLRIDRANANVPSSATFTATISGRKVLDYRTATMVSSANPALILYDILTHTEDWLAIPTSRFDTSAGSTWRTVADHCDTAMADGTKRYSFSGLIRDRDPLRAIETIRQHGFIDLHFVRSKYMLADRSCPVAGPRAIEIGAGDWQRPPKFRRIPARKVPNHVEIKYTRPDTWQAGSVAVEDPAGVSAAEMRRSEITLSGCISRSAAYRWGVKYFNLLRLERFTWQGTVREAAVADVIPGQIITMSTPGGVTSQPVRVESMTDAGNGWVQVELAEYDDGTDSTDVATEDDPVVTDGGYTGGAPSPPSSCTLELVEVGPWAAQSLVTDPDELTGANGWAEDDDAAPTVAYDAGNDWTELTPTVASGGAEANDWRIQVASGDGLAASVAYLLVALQIGVDSGTDDTAWIDLEYRTSADGSTWTPRFTRRITPTRGATLRPAVYQIPVTAAAYQDVGLVLSAGVNRWKVRRFHVVGRALRPAQNLYSYDLVERWTWVEAGDAEETTLAYQARKLYPSGLPALPLAECPQGETSLEYSILPGAGSLAGRQGGGMGGSLVSTVAAWMFVLGIGGALTPFPAPTTTVVDEVAPTQPDDVTLTWVHWKETAGGQSSNAASWYTEGKAPTVTDNTEAAPDGTTSADLLEFDSGAGQIQDRSDGPTVRPGSNDFFIEMVWIKHADAGDLEITIRSECNAGYLRKVAIHPTWQLLTMVSSFANAPYASPALHCANGDRLTVASARYWTLPGSESWKEALVMTWTPAADAGTLDGYALQYRTWDAGTDARSGWITHGTVDKTVSRISWGNLRLADFPTLPYQDTRGSGSGDLHLYDWRVVAIRNGMVTALIVESAAEMDYPDGTSALMAEDVDAVTTGDVLAVTSISGQQRLSPVLKAFTGSGSPESVITAPVGSLYVDTAGGAGTTLYVKESGTGNTGWAAK